MLSRATKTTPRATRATRNATCPPAYALQRVCGIGQPVLTDQPGQCDVVVDRQFLEQAGLVRVHRLRAQTEALGNIFLTQALRQQQGDLHLTRRQRIERRIVATQSGQGQILRNVIGEVTLATGNITHRTQQFGGIATLAHVAGRTSRYQALR